MGLRQMFPVLASEGWLNKREWARASVETIRVSLYIIYCRCAHFLRERRAHLLPDTLHRRRHRQTRRTSIGPGTRRSSSLLAQNERPLVGWWGLRDLHLAYFLLNPFPITRQLACASLRTSAVLAIAGSTSRRQ